MPQRRRSDAQPKRDPIREAIASRAYELFLARGRTHGHDAEDWFTAEAELVHRPDAASQPVRRERSTS